MPALTIITNLFFSSLCKIAGTRTIAVTGLVSYILFGAGMYMQMLLFFIYPANFALMTGRGSTMSGNEITLIMVGLDLIAAVIGIMFGLLYIIQAYASRKYQALKAL